MATPTNINELVDQLIKYENENKQLRKKNKSLTMVSDQTRQKAVAMLTQATKKSSFTNYEVKQMARGILDTLEKPPLLK